MKFSSKQSIPAVSAREPGVGAYFDEEERELIEATERGEFVQLPGSAARRKEMQEAARYTLALDRNSILHQFAAGTLRERD